MPAELDLLFSEAVPNDVVEVYDEQTSNNWRSDPELNALYLRVKHNYLLDTLLVRGHVFLNDIHDELGMPRTPIGQIRGWLLTDERSDRQDSFSFWEVVQVDDNSNGIILSFSTDGPIWNRI
jgi:hypothetical protein